MSILKIENKSTYRAEVVNFVISAIEKHKESDILGRGSLGHSFYKQFGVYGGDNSNIDLVYSSLCCFLKYGNLKRHTYTDILVFIQDLRVCNDKPKILDSDNNDLIWLLYYAIKKLEFESI